MASSSAASTDLNIKVRPPFPLLPAFNVSALILAFLSYEDVVEALLNLLNHNTLRYYSCHREILKGFLDPWKPEVSRVVEFGSDFYNWNDVYPTPK